MSQYQNNIDARKAAEEYIALAEEQPLRFWEVVIELAKAKLPPEKPQEDKYPPYNDVEATRFESVVVPYGKYEGEQVWLVPVDYLLFLTEGDEFSQRLRRYAKSKRFYDRQE